MNFETVTDMYICDDSRKSMYRLFSIICASARQLRNEHSCASAVSNILVTVPTVARGRLDEYRSSDGEKRFHVVSTIREQRTITSENR